VIGYGNGALSKLQRLIGDRVNSRSTVKQAVFGMKMKMYKLSHSGSSFLLGYKLLFPSNLSAISTILLSRWERPGFEIAGENIEARRASE
jgi:hypothetical protein